MAHKSANTLYLAEQLIVQSMTDAELDACIAQKPDPEFQAMLETLSMGELDACFAGDVTPLIRRGWQG